MKIELNNLKDQYIKIKSNINKRINRVFQHGQFILGPEVVELENKLKNFVGVKYCIAVSSGTDALLISLMAINIKPGDEIITTPFTFVSTVEVICLLGAKPVFVDIEFDTCNINAELIEKKITNKTKAIIPVSLFGQPADMDFINKIGAKYNLIVIEDAAQSFGSIYKGKKSCNLSDIGCTSFFPSKPLGCYGDGGAIFTNNKNISKICRELRVHGQGQKYIYNRIGIGGRIDTLQSAILLAKLDIFEWEIKQREVIAKNYHKLLKELNKNSLQAIKIKNNRKSVYAQFTLISKNRDKIQKHLKSLDIGTNVYYPVPINEQPCYSHLCCPECTPIAKDLSKKVFSIPMSAYLTLSEQRHIISNLF